MLEIASQIILCLLIAALLGAIIGYLLGKGSCPDNDAYQGKIYISRQPTFLTEPRVGGKDNLQLIRGIGETIEKLLNEQGIYHFDQIANWTKEEARWIDSALAFPGRVMREKWIEQANELAIGNSTEFSTRVESGEVPTSKKS